jgi:hypothetical protein
VQRWKSKEETKNERRPKRERESEDKRPQKEGEERGLEKFVQSLLNIFGKKYIIGIYSIETEAKITRLLLYSFLLCKAKLVAVPRVTRNQIT